MSAADDIKKGLTNAVMAECYAKASDNGRLPATARQIYYVAGPLIEERTDKPLNYAYFSQTLLPNYVEEHGGGWDVVYDDRGHFAEPHVERVIGLGTLNVRGYLSRIGSPKFEEADFAPASVKTYGPDGSYGAVLFVEKEGFLPLFERVNLAKRYDIGLMSSKGMSTTAARELVDRICGGVRSVPLLVLHDFDAAGVIIRDTLQNDTRRYRFASAPEIVDFGLHYSDVGGLPSEPSYSTISDERLAKAGLGEDAINFLRDRRVELNALTSRQLVDFVEAKLKQHGVRKVVPDAETLARTYQLFAASDRLSEAFDEMKEKLDHDYESKTVPDDLEAKVTAMVAEHPEMTWHRALRLIVDPDAPEDGDDDAEPDDDLDDEGLSDVE